MSDRDRAEVIARAGGGFVAFAPPPPKLQFGPSTAPVTRPVRVTTAPAPAYATTLVTYEPKKQKSMAAELLPLLALVVGVPLLVWWNDKKQNESFRRA